MGNTKLQNSPEGASYQGLLRPYSVSYSPRIGAWKQSIKAGQHGAFLPSGSSQQAIQPTRNWLFSGPPDDMSGSRDQDTSGRSKRTC